MKERQQGKLLVFPDAPRIIKESQIPPSRRITRPKKEGVLIDLEEERRKRKPPIREEWPDEPA